MTEQPLPPNGACLLGSFNLTRYCKFDDNGLPYFDFHQLRKDVYPIHRMMDNVIDRTIYPLKVQEEEAKNKRRMGLGITGLANALEFLGFTYGSEDSIHFTESVMKTLRDETYWCSSVVASKKGSFPLFDRDKYLQSEFVKTLPKFIRDSIYENGIRNSHLLSIAPTGTISLWAGNISGGIEPVFSHDYYRNAYMPDGEIRRFRLQDYAVAEWGLYGLTSDEISAEDHIKILCAASKLVDSACSKTCNVGRNVTFDQFKNLYMQAYDGGASGCTTYRPASLEEGVSTRGAVLTHIEEEEDEGGACFIDPQTGERSCVD